MRVINSTQFNKILVNALVIFFALAPFTSEAQNTEQYAMMVLRKNHRQSEVLHLQDSFYVEFGSGEKKKCVLDTLLETGFMSKGNWIPFSALQAIYVERNGFVYITVFRPLGPALLIFGTYLLLNSAGLAVIHGVSDWRARMAFRNAMRAYGSGTISALVADRFAEKKLPLGKYQINVF